MNDLNNNNTIIIMMNNIELEFNIYNTLDKHITF